MLRPKAAIFRLSKLQFCSKSVTFMSVLHIYVYIYVYIYIYIASLCKIDIYMTLFEQNCNCDNLKMVALGRNM